MRTNILKTITIDRKRFELVYQPAGVYAAGSGTRTHGADRYTSRVWIDGTSHGAHYATRAEAEADYARRTSHYGQIAERT